MKGQDQEAWRLVQAAGAALNKRDFATAQKHARALLLRYPRDPNANQILGIVALEQGEFANARAFLEKADAAAPNQPQILNSLGVARRRLGDTDGARIAFERAGSLGLVDGWRNLGNLESSLYATEASIGAYERALKIAPSDAASEAGLAQAYEAKHALADAKTHATAALRLDPGNVVARIALGYVLLREQDFSGAEATVRPVLETASPANRALALGVVGEARDRAGDARGAFEAFAAANRILLEQNQSLISASDHLYHPDSVRRMRALVEADVSVVHPPQSQTGPSPVFLIGFPRSGTTLLDQILASHSRIVCMEEREHFAAAASPLIKNGVVEEMSTAEQLEAVCSDYWRRVNEEEPDRGVRILVDKLPLNIVLLPLIHRVFPDAKIIFALRDPRDVILSCLQQRFVPNAAMIQLLDLQTAASYYDNVMSLAETCRANLALNIHQVRYEDVVANLEAQARQLATFLDLAFEDGMLRFQETALARTINTPSSRQVVQPLYNRSVGRWQSYPAELAPVLPILNPWVERYGYPAS